MRLAGAAVLGILLLPGGCKRPAPAAVVVYTSVDEPYARPIMDAFTRLTGTRARPVFDTEANKSRGLAGTILAEMPYSRADVFWSSEVMQMLRLKKAGALQPYRSPSAEGIPARYRDSDGYWTGFAARCRVLVVNRERVKTPPRSLLALTDVRWRGEVAMPNPLFGSTMTEAAALFQTLGSARARAYYRARLANKTRIVDGNSMSAEDTARGEVLVGQTDTDDAFIRVDAHDPLEVVFPDQNGMGALVIPNTAAMVRGAPHPEQARRFLDFLLRAETELLLAGLPSRQLPLHEGLRNRLPEQVRRIAAVRAMRVDYSRLLDGYDEVDAFLRELFLR